MGWYRERVLPHLIDRACGTADLQVWRERVMQGLSGSVVEIGFGSGLNVASYPAEITVVYAVEPAEVARRLAATRIAESPVSVEHVGLRGEEIPLDDESCDNALSTFTLCTIPDAAAALAELRRVLKPGGELHFLEHGLSPDPKIARWQHRLDPIEQRLADGCHLTRDPVAMVEAAGFTMLHHDSRYAKGPKPWTWMTTGIAAAP